MRDVASGAERHLNFFLEWTEAIATSLIPLETILPKKCVFFIISFSCIVCAKMRSLLTPFDGVLTAAI